MDRLNLQSHDDFSTLCQRHFRCHSQLGQGRRIQCESLCRPFVHVSHATLFFFIRFISESVTLYPFVQMKLSLMRWRLQQTAPAVIGNMGIQPLYSCQKIRNSCASILATRKFETASTSSWRARRNESRNQWSAIFPHHVGDRHKRNDNLVLKSCMGVFGSPTA